MTHRDPLFEALKDYETHWLQNQTTDQIQSKVFLEDQQNTLTAFCLFVEAHSQCFERSLAVGHVTASALVVNPKLDQVLLLHHRKLKKWLQLGGHCDGNADTKKIALKEAHEESGLPLNELSFLNYENSTPEKVVAFDLDIHVIPERKQEAAHKHYDIRYLILADPLTPLRPNHESNDLRWFTLNEAKQITSELSMHRQFEKVAAIRSKLFS